MTQDFSTHSVDLTQAIFRDQSVLLTIQKRGKHNMMLKEFCPLGVMKKKRILSSTER